MPKTKTKTKDAGTMDTATLVDEIGGLAAIIADFDKKKKALVVELLARAGDRHYIDGNLFTATIVPEHIAMLLDSEAIKLEMGDDWVTAHSKESVRKTSVRVTARKTEDRKERVK